MSEQEPNNTKSQDLHRMIFAVLNGYEVNDRLAALSAIVAEQIVGYAPKHDRVKWQRMFAQNVREFVHMIDAAMLHK